MFLPQYDQTGRHSLAKRITSSSNKARTGFIPESSTTMVTSSMFPMVQGDQTLTHHGSRRQPNASLAQQILLSAAASLGLSTNMPTALMESSLCSELVQLQNATPVFGKQGSSEQTKCDRCRREFFLKCVKVSRGV